MQGWAGDPRRSPEGNHDGTQQSTKLRLTCKHVLTKEAEILSNTISISESSQMAPKPGLRRSSRRTNPLSTSPIIAVVGSVTKDIIFETERMPDLGQSVAGTTLATMHGGKGANIAIAAHRASRHRPKSDSIYDTAAKGAIKAGEM
jgi:hypothetical protein